MHFLPMFQQLQRSDWNSYRKRKIEIYERARKNKEVDDDLIPILDKINNLEKYVTISSCSGRIVVIEVENFGKKEDSEFLGKWHQNVSFEEIFSAILKARRQTWLIQYPPIIHIACKDFICAKRLLEVSNNVGFRRSGIISIENLIVEVSSLERLELPVAIEGRILMSEDYLRTVVEFANKKLKKGKEKLKKFEEVITFL
ncbi:MAG: hypothetical protein RMH75_03185 [Archaeoglobaceae archaeon]|nr:hypothetical protein [Archaeoglobaceae archaeon]MDW7989659.1 hypothetical protein [Archaeoglobaceae archaeon]